MACTHGYQEKIHQYIDQEMSYNEELTFKNHLMNCENCLLHFRELNNVEKQLKNAPAISQPSTFKQDILNRLPKEFETKEVRQNDQRASFDYSLCRVFGYVNDVSFHRIPIRSKCVCFKL